MLGQMMDHPLLVTSLLRHAEKLSPRQEIVSVTHDNPRHRYTYADAFRKVRQLSNGMAKLGLKKGDVIGTLAWNDYRHFEIYYATACSGIVCHTINPRLFPEQIEYIINHGEDQWLFVDALILPLIEQLAAKLPRIQGYIILSDAEHMPATSLDNVYCYDDFVAQQSTEENWPQLDENDATAMCYTSGTTGHPKGVVYSHRSTILHAYAGVMPDVLNLSMRDSLLPIVPMFHVNAWGTPYAAPLVGCKLVFPGPKMGDGETLTTLINEESVNISAGVPTIWQNLLAYLKESGKTVEPLQRVIVGGAACPLSVMEAFEKEHEVYVHAAWGMTEMSPIGTFNKLPKAPESYSRDEFNELRVKAGRPVFGVEIKIVDENDAQLPWDGKAFGALKVRGPWITSGYFKAETATLDENGWFDTGDVATINPDGNMQITDRSKDVIKSGGEWISSIDVENAASDHPAIALAAVIGVPHPKWSERPLLIVVKAPGEEIDKQAVLDWLDGKIAKWWMPDDVVFTDEIPMTATGKISKKDLREHYKGHLQPAQS